MPGRYAFGTDSSAPLNNQGKELVKKMDELGIILDTTHLCDLAFWDALEIYQGPVWASHNNCRALVDHNRQFSDEMIKALVDRGAVIGGAFDAWMLSPGWVRGKSTPKERAVTISTVLDHLDHICQIAGNANHIGIGSDLDGAFGTEQCPSDLERIADLQKKFLNYSKKKRLQGFRHRKSNAWQLVELFEESLGLKNPGKSSVPSLQATLISSRRWITTPAI